MTAEAPSATRLTEFCLRRCDELGFARYGVTSAAPLAEPTLRLEDFLRRKYHGEMGYLAQRSKHGDLLRSDPAAVFPEARSIVCVALSYRRGDSDDDDSAETATPKRDSALSGSIARYARRHDYHLILKGMLLELADGLATAHGSEIRSRICVDSAPLLERDLAVRAGLGFLGKNTLAIAPGAGSFFVLGELLLDVELEQTAEREWDGCGSCTRCLAACPTEAFAEAFRLDARRCISYLTIEARETIPRDLRAQVGARVFGCDVCQEVCPYNHGSKAGTAPERFSRASQLEDLSLVSLLQLTSSEYKRLTYGTPLRRASRAQLARNAAVGLGNSGDVRAVSPLAEAAVRHPSAQVREASTWALGRLFRDFGHSSAKGPLEELRTSDDLEVRREAERWLSLPESSV